MFQSSAHRSYGCQLGVVALEKRRAGVGSCVLRGMSVALVLSCSSCGGAERRPPPAPPQPEPAPIAVPAEPVAPAEPALRGDVAAAPLSDSPEISVAQWHERHAALLQAPGRHQAEIVVLGDSIAQRWCDSRAFAKKWGKLRPLNLALPSEQTQQLLWRIEHGALEGLSPRLAIVAVGAANLEDGFPPRAAAEGIAAVVRRVHETLPEAAILVVALLPAGQAPSDPRRARIEAVNRELADLAAEVAGGAERAADRIVVSDVGGTFLDADGSISAGVMEDAVHPTALGYEALTLSVSLVADRLLARPGR